MDKKENWIKIADNINEIVFGEKKIALIEIEGKKICIIQTFNGLKACSAKCPHAGGDLSAGYLDKKENIICPVHSYRFNINTGRDTYEEGYFLKIFRIKENENGIFVELE